MSIFPAIETYLALQGHKYISPDKAGELREMMLEPMFALRLYGKPRDFGVSLEVSFIERKKDETSLTKQNRVLQVPIATPVYYLAQINGVSQRFAGIEENRQYLSQQVKTGQVRKVLVKYDVDLAQATSIRQVLDELQAAMITLIPFYEATREL